MLVNADVRALEWCSYLYLSQDQVGIDEWNKGLDIHSNNQKDIGVPTRLIAKKFLFRNIYKGSAYAYARDPEFTEISDNPKYWQKIIDAFYEKYQGIKKLHDKLIKEAVETKRVTSPLGRSYIYEPFTNKFNGALQWPESDICNHINQGFGSDLMALARVWAKKELHRNPEIDAMFVNSVHDSLLADSHKSCYNSIAEIMKTAIELIPQNFEKVFNKPFNVVMRAEISIGSNYANLEEIK
jgi:DNA polymerase I-like protein with 3'-5' exonuclease and polymerase domains